MPVVLTLSLTMIGIPSSGRLSPSRSRCVGRLRVGEGRRADRDHRVERWVEVTDALEIEVRQLHGAQLAELHQRLQLRDRRRVDVDTGDRGVSGSRGPSAPRRRMPRARGPAGSSEQGNAEVGCSSRDLHGIGESWTSDAPSPISNSTNPVEGGTRACTRSNAHADESRSAYSIRTRVR